MAANELTRAILSHLWTSYREDPGASFDISPLCKKAGSDPVMVSNGLRLEGLIKDEVLIEEGGVLCAISIAGVKLIDARYVEDRIRDVLMGMGEANSISNVFDILKLDARQFQFAFDLANEMQNRDLVKLLYAFQPGKVVNVEMTLEGVRSKSRA